jgi:hypothetical protein
MKKGRRALSLKKRLDNQNIYDHAQINEKKSSTNTSFRTCRKESAGQNVKSACGGLCVRSHTASRRAVSGASCPCGAGLVSTQSLRTQCTITIINGSGMTPAAHVGGAAGDQQGPTGHVQRAVGRQPPAWRGGEQVAYQGRKKRKTTNMLFLTDSQGIPLACS